MFLWQCILYWNSISDTCLSVHNDAKLFMQNVFWRSGTFGILLFSWKGVFFICESQTHSPELIYKKTFSQRSKFTGKYLCQSLFFNKVVCLEACRCIEKRLWRRCFPVNFAKFLRTYFLTEHLWSTAYGELVSFNPFHVTSPILYPLKTENQRFSNDFKGYRKWNLQNIFWKTVKLLAKICYIWTGRNEFKSFVTEVPII